MSSSSAAALTAEQLEASLSQIERLLSTDPAAAERQAAELLRLAPAQPMALLFQGIARRMSGNASGAVDVLRPLCESCPEAPLPHLQLGLALRQLGQDQAAAASIRRATETRPDFSDAWRALGDVLTAAGEPIAAEEAFGEYVRQSARDPRVTEAAAALRENRLVEADSFLRKELKSAPDDIVLLCLLADVSARQRRFDVAETALERCLEIAPGYRTARHNYAVVLMRQDRPEEALQEVEFLLTDARSRSLGILQAALLVRLLRYEDAIEVYRDLLNEQAEPGIWASLGHALRTVGRIDECVDAYRKAIALAPQFGEAYWNLANLKTVRIADEELQAIREQLGRNELGAEDRIHFHFALGKATEERERFAESFEHYAEGNRLRRASVQFDARALSAHVERSKVLLTRAFYEERNEFGAESGEPVFIVGLPRAGSTLVEQILASHSLVEGTMELPHLAGIAKTLVEQKGVTSETRFVDLLARINEHESRQTGELYLQRTAAQRKRLAPFFIDKMPNNFAHIALIQLALPNARIIDVRRHPMACGLSVFKHLFASGQTFSYSLEEIAFYYGEYVKLMTHFDAVLPGRVHRVIYESLVENFESEVHRLLDYCGLPFEQSCLRFHENRRAVSTPSSEQVRTPIFRNGLEHWRHYQPWLGPLEAGLGPLLEHWSSGT